MSCDACKRVPVRFLIDRPCFYCQEDVTVRKSVAATPPPGEDVRAALVRKFTAFIDDWQARSCADAILTDPLLGRLLRGGR